VNDETEFEGERRPILRRRRPEPDPAPDKPDDAPRETERRRRFFRELARGVGSWWRLFVESPVVLRFIFWALFVLVLALILRTLRGTRP